MRRLSVLLLLLLSYVRLAGAQTTPPSQTTPSISSSPPAAEGSPQFSPGAAYDEAVRPLDIVRRAAQNWSDVELAALGVAKGQAKQACAERTPAEFNGEDLLAYARLCAFAQLWPQVQKAGTNYLIAYNAAKPEDKLTGFPGLSIAFDYVVQASLHQNNSTNAFGTAQVMLRTVTYDDLASDAVNATVHYVQLVHMDQALILLEQRQPLLLAMLRARGMPGMAAATAPPARPPLTIHDVYADAVALPAMQQFANKPVAAAASFAELEAALPVNLSPDDAILTAASRRQYQLLGSPLPAIAASAWLLDPAFKVPHDLNEKYGAASLFLLFPDWCAQCVSMSPQLTDTATRFNKSAVYFYALLAQAAPLPPTPLPAPKLTMKPAATVVANGSRPTGAKAGLPHMEIQLSAKPVAAELLMGTPTLIVPRETLNRFVGTDFPLLIATDHAGIVRYIGIAPDNVLVPDGLAEQIADRIMEQWPPSGPR